MSDTLRDQLLGLGFKPTPKPERQPDARPHGHRGKSSAMPSNPPARSAGALARGERRAGKPGPQADRRDPRTARTPEEIGLAKAYAIRAHKEKEERIEAERLKQEEARQRREAKAKLAQLLHGKPLNQTDADIARHFLYGGKIKRIYVNAEQLKALNAGELGVVQFNGRYLLVSAAVLAEAEVLFAPAIALKVDPHAPADADPYADPQYQVPDDLVW